MMFVYATWYNNAMNGIAIDTGFLHSHSDRQAGYHDSWNAGTRITDTNQQSESSSLNIRAKISIFQSVELRRDAAEILSNNISYPPVVRSSTHLVRDQ